LQRPDYAANLVSCLHGPGRCWTIRFTVPAPARTPGRASNGTALYDLRNRAGLYDGRWLLAGGAERSGPIRIECPRFAAAIPPRRSRCYRIRPFGPVVSGLFHGIALAAQQRELQCRQSLQHVAYADRFWHLWWTAYHQPAGGSFRVRVKSAMVPEVLGSSRAATGSLWWACPLHKDSRRQLSVAFRCPEFAGPGGD